MKKYRIQNNVDMVTFITGEMMWYISLKLNILYNLIYLIKIFYAHYNIQCIENNYTIMKFYKKHPVITIIMFLLILLKTIIVTVVTMKK